MFDPSTVTIWFNNFTRIAWTWTIWQGLICLKPRISRPCSKRKSWWVSREVSISQSSVALHLHEQAAQLPKYSKGFTHPSIYIVHSISFQILFVQAFKIGVDSWNSSMLLLYILLDDWPIFMISGSNEQLLHQLEYTLLKPYCHSWWISKMQFGREDTLKERYAIKVCFKFEKNATETYGMLKTAFGAFWMNLASVFGWHKRFKGGRDPVRDDERCWRSKEGNTPKLIAQRVWVRVTMLRF